MYGLTNSTLGIVTSANTATNFMGTNYGSYGTYNNFGGYGMGFGGYGYGANVTDVEKAKENMQNNYSIYTAQQGYNGKQQVESLTYSQQSQNISTLLDANRNDDAAKEFEKLVNSIKAAPQYSMCTDAEARAIAQSHYRNATGSNLVNDIQEKSSSSFVQGLKMGVPILGLFESSNSREDLVSKVTGAPASAKDAVAKGFGACLSGGALVGGTVAGLSALKTAGKGAGLLSKIPLPKAGKAGLIAAGIAAVVTLGATLLRGNKTTTA